MTEEDYFRKTYPDYCYGGKPLSPYWDFFQDGVEFGERQSEKKVEELEESSKELQKLVQQREQRGLEVQEDLLKEKEELEAQIEKMKADVIECFGSEYNVLVTKLLDKWEIKEND